jgi:hypothetical protein
VLARLAALALLAPGAALGLDHFEIQVYQPDIDDPGQVSLEVHTNFTGRGAREATFPGEIPPHRTARMTLEPAVGVTSWLELGAYLQGFVAPASGARYGGAKLRAKMVAPPPLGERTFLGVNVEVGHAPSELDPVGWGSEIRPFLGYDDGLLLIALNPIFDLALSGPDAFRPDLEPAAKVALNTQLGFALGVEWYAELGPVDAIRRLAGQAHYLFGVVDLAAPRGRPASRWELNLAVGGGLGGAADQQLIVKTIVGTAF